MQLKPINILSLIALFQSLLLALFLITHKEKKANIKSNRLLALMLLVFAIFLASQFILKETKQVEWLFISHLTLQVFLLVGPLLYLYIHAFFNPRFSINWKHGLYFIPFLIVVGWIVVKYHSMQGVGTYLSIGMLLRSNWLLFNFIFLVFSIRLLLKNGLKLKSFFQLPDNDPVSWLRFFVTGCMVFWIIKLAVFISWDLSGANRMCLHLINLNILVVFLFLNTIVYMALRGPDQFAQLSKNGKPLISDDDFDRFENKLISYMDTEKPYLDSTLSLTELSSQLAIPMRYLSCLINEKFKMNFFDFINKYRIQSAKSILKDRINDKITVLEVAYEVGFNSKSTFNAAFKKHTGLTPSEYRKQNISS